MITVAYPSSFRSSPYAPGPNYFDYDYDYSSELDAALLRRQYHQAQHARRAELERAYYAARQRELVASALEQLAAEADARRTEQQRRQQEHLRLLAIQERARAERRRRLQAQRAQEQRAQLVAELRRREQLARAMDEQQRRRLALEQFIGLLPPQAIRQTHSHDESPLLRRVHFADPPSAAPGPDAAPRIPAALKGKWRAEPAPAQPACSASDDASQVAADAALAALLQAGASLPGVSIRSPPSVPDASPAEAHTSCVPVEVRAPKPVRPVAQSLEDSLRTRLGNEADQDMRATLEGLMHALFNSENAPARAPAQAPSAPAPTQAPSASASAPAPAQSSPAPAESSATPATRPAPDVQEEVIPSPSPDTRLRALSAISSITSELSSLASRFTLPSALDRATPERPASPASDSGLPYTSRNAPVHAYEHALNALLERLDAVVSDGDEAVRAARREAVKSVERELARVEELVRGQAAEEAAPSEFSEDEAPSVDHPEELVADVAEGIPESTQPTESPTDLPALEESAVEATQDVVADANTLEDPTLADEVIPHITEVAQPAEDIVQPAEVGQPSEDTVTEEVVQPSEDDTQPADEVAEPIKVAQEPHAEQIADTHSVVDALPSLSSEERASSAEEILEKVEDLSEHPVESIASPADVSPVPAEHTEEAAATDPVASSDDHPDDASPSPAITTISLSSVSSVSTSHADDEGAERPDTFLLPASRAATPDLKPAASADEEDAVLVDVEGAKDDWLDVEESL